MVEALRYKSEGRGFESRLCHWNFYWLNPTVPSVALGFTQPLTEMSTRIFSWGEGGKGGRCVGLTTLPPSCADCLVNWEPQLPGAVWACPGL